jgi:excisionase family DNA binding protein
LSLFVLYRAVWDVYRPSTILRFLRIKGLDNKAMERMPSVVNAARFDVGTLHAFNAQVQQLNRDEALSLVDEAVSCGASTEAVVTGLLAPALVDVGRRWAAAELGAAEAQVASTIARTALLRCPSRTPSRDRPRVIVGCPEGEQHQIAAEMVTELLRAYGWPAELVGRGVPPKELGRFLARRRPVGLLLSCTTPSGLVGAARAIDAAHDVGIPVLVGGAAFGRDDTRAMRLGAAAWAPSVKTAEAILEGWSSNPPALSPSRALSDEYIAFESALHDIRAQALDVLRRHNLRRREDLADIGPIHERLDLLLEHLGAAVLVDDPAVLNDFLSSRVAFLRARDEPIDRLLRALEAVATSLGQASQRAHRFVRAALTHLQAADGTSGRPVTLPAAPTPAPTPIAAVANEDAQPAGEGGQVRNPAGPDVQQGQIFADLLFLAALSCHAPMALISVAQPDSAWSTLSYGVDRREALTDPALFSFIAQRDEALEIRDMSGHDRLRSSSLATGTLQVRFLYAVPLRSRQDSTLGVFCVLDRRSRELSKREQQAMQVIARQVAGQLALWRRSASPATPAAEHPADRRQPDRPGPDAALVELLGLRRTGLAVDQHLLRSHEVAMLFDVTERTVTNWAASKKLPSWRTAGGHLRFRTEDVLALLASRTDGWD